MHEKPSFHCPRTGCGRAFHRSDWLERHIQRQLVSFLRICPSEILAAGLTNAPVSPTEDRHPDAVDGLKSYASPPLSNSTPRLRLQPPEAQKSFGGSCPDTPRIAVSSVPGSQQTKELEISQLRTCLRSIIDETPTTGEAVDQILALLKQLRLPWLEDAKVTPRDSVAMQSNPLRRFEVPGPEDPTGAKVKCEEVTEKDVMMQTSLLKKPGSSSVSTSADSGFASSDSSWSSRGWQFGWPFVGSHSYDCDLFEPPRDRFSAEINEPHQQPILRTGMYPMLDVIPFDTGASVFSFLGGETWQSDKGKEPADSAYGSMKG